MLQKDMVRDGERDGKLRRQLSDPGVVSLGAGGELHRDLMQTLSSFCCCLQNGRRSFGCTSKTFLVIAWCSDPLFPIAARTATVVACCPGNSEWSMAETPGSVERGRAVRVKHEKRALSLDAWGSVRALMRPLGMVARFASRISTSEKTSALVLGSCGSEIAISPCALAAGTASLTSDKKSSVLSVQSPAAEIIFV